MKKILFLALFFCLFSSGFALNPSYVQKADISITFQGRVDLSKLDAEEAGFGLKICSFSDQKNSNLLQQIKSIKHWLLVDGEAEEFSGTEKDGENTYLLYSVEGKTVQQVEYFIEAEILVNSALGFSDYNLSNGILNLEEFKQTTAYINPEEPRIKEIAASLKRDSEIQTIHNTLAYVHNTLEYDGFFIGEISNSSKVLESKRGTCDEFSNFAAALLRANSIPTRVIVGLVFNGSKWGEHAWIEVFVPEEGWIAVDPTFNEMNINGFHITLAKASDFSEIVSTILHPEGSQVRLYRSLQVSNFLKENFNPLQKDIAFSLELKKNEKAGKIFAVLELENLLNKSVVFPVEILCPEEFGAKDAKKTVFLKPFEKRTIEWEAAVQEMPNYSYLYEFSFLSPIGSESKSIKFRPLLGGKSLELYSVSSGLGEKTVINITLENKDVQRKETEIEIIYNDEKETERYIVMVEPFVRETFSIALKKKLLSPKVLVEATTEEGTQRELLILGNFMKPLKKEEQSSPNILEPMMGIALVLGGIFFMLQFRNLQKKKN